MFIGHLCVLFGQVSVQNPLCMFGSWLLLGMRKSTKAIERDKEREGPSSSLGQGHVCGSDAQRGCGHLISSLRTKPTCSLGQNRWDWGERRPESCHSIESSLCSGLPGCERTNILKPYTVSVEAFCNSEQSHPKLMHQESPLSWGSGNRWKMCRWVNGWMGMCGQVDR